MTDEEKKAIERIQRLVKYFEDWDAEVTVEPEDKKYFDTILNLIEKQQKEIEELKVRNNKLAQCHFRYEEMTGIDLLLPDKLEYISKEESKQKEKQAYIDGTNAADKLCNKKWERKIKAKIEELKAIADNGANAVRFAMTHEDEIERIQKQKDISAMIDILRSLLEKE